MDLNQVTLPCSDLDASIAFYMKLGLVQIVHSPPDYARFECPSGSTLSLHRLDAPRSGPGAVIYFEVASVDERVRELQQAGLSFDVLPQDQPWLWREAYLRDPYGNLLCIFHAGSNRRNPPWRLAAQRSGS